MRMVSRRSWAFASWATRFSTTNPKHRFRRPQGTNQSSHDLGFGGDFSKVPGRIHHVAFCIPSYEELLRAADLLLESGTPIEFGPGKHGIGEQGRLYFRRTGRLTRGAQSGGYRNYIPLLGSQPSGNPRKDPT